MVSVETLDRAATRQPSRLRLVGFGIAAATLFASVTASAQQVQASVEASAQVSGQVTVGAPVVTPPPPPQASVTVAPVQAAYPVYGQGGYVVQPGYVQPGYVQPGYVQPGYVQPGYVYSVPSGSRAPMPYNGGPVPPGGRVETRPLTGLAIAGGSVFGAMWLIDAIAGLSVSSGGSEWMAVPIVGPFVFVGMNYSPSVAGSAALLIATGVIQIGGVAMLIGGLAAKRQVVVFADGSTHQDRSIRWAVLPGTDASPLGATLTLTHF